MLFLCYLYKFLSSSDAFASNESEFVQFLRSSGEAESQAISWEQGWEILSSQSLFPYLLELAHSRSLIPTALSM